MAEWSFSDIALDGSRYFARQARQIGDVVAGIGDPGGGRLAATQTGSEGGKSMSASPKQFRKPKTRVGCKPKQCKGSKIRVSSDPKRLRAVNRCDSSGPTSSDHGKRVLTAT